MTTKWTGSIVGAIVVVAIAVLVWFPAEQSSELPALIVQSPTPVQKLAPADTRSVPLPSPPGEVYPENDISFEAYFARFGGIAAVDLKTKKIREGVAAKIREEMVGTQVTWNGYVDRIADASSGKVTLVLAMTDGPAGLDTALISFPAALHDQLHGYQKGDHVRVVAVFDEIITVFPLLHGKSAEWIPKG
jgi:hypothetical protein